ncbi:hypothetical protein [Pectobacterium carotovorum]|uniref:hypothetical protein n=1 Tax=Pectobacterium carotovorum TaxID=554 RepID=UPI001E52AF55|nr:hypothetical protein [Pectobacterium carotovorum]UFT95022.1 hypothetical protein LQF52_03020 [Pectobacterium carotovorum]
MNILTNERLNKIASWRETYGTNTNVMLPAKEAEELVQRLLRAETKLADLYAQKPFMHGIGDPDGNAYFDECCVGNMGLMDAQVTNLNDDLEEGEPRYSVVALYREPVPDERNKRISELEAQLAASGQKAKNYEEVAHGLSGEVDVLKAQLAELEKQAPVGKLKEKQDELETTDRIVPVLPVRDEYGFWRHPNRIETPFDEGGASTRIYEAWFAERGMAVDFTYMNQVFCDDCVYGENIEHPALHWNPESPYGDGWLLTAIFDTEEGPCAEWVRYRSSDSDKEAG